MEKINEILSHTLREWRKKNGKEQKAAAKELGVTRAAWNHWENGVRFPTGHQLTLLSKLTGIEVCQLLCCHNGQCAECPGNNSLEHKHAASSTFSHVNTGKQRVATKR
jgi:transcriptional regulator with XRE-family HTH domain